MKVQLNYKITSKTRRQERWILGGSKYQVTQWGSSKSYMSRVRGRISLEFSCVIWRLLGRSLCDFTIYRHLGAFDGIERDNGRRVDQNPTHRCRQRLGWRNKFDTRSYVAFINVVTFCITITLCNAIAFIALNVPGEHACLSVWVNSSVTYITMYGHMYTTWSAHARADSMITRRHVHRKGKRSRCWSRHSQRQQVCRYIPLRR